MEQLQTYEQILCINIAMLGLVEVFLCPVSQSAPAQPARVDATYTSTPSLKMYSWIFFRSAFGMSIVASFWRYSGSRVQCKS